MVKGMVWVCHIACRMGPYFSYFIVVHTMAGYREEGEIKNGVKFGKLTNYSPK